MSLPHGVFISFEGSEGCGKTTQIQRLAARLEAAGQPVLLTREPGGTPLGETIRYLLKYAEEGRDMVPEAELLLFAASRAQLMRRVIEPALQAGQWVIADRFLDSTTVYQGVARRLNPEAVCFINEFAVGERRPNMTFKEHVRLKGLGSILDDGSEDKLESSRSVRAPQWRLDGPGVREEIRYARSGG